MSNTLDEPLITSKEAAAILGISARHVRDLCAEGKLPHVRLGSVLRFDRSTLATWLENRLQESVHAPLRPGRSVVHGLSVQPAPIPPVAWPRRNDQEGS